jgi:hypothetical protein
MREFLSAGGRFSGLGLLVVLTASSSLLFAQAPDTVWTKVYRGPYGECGYSLKQTSNGGFIIAGETSSFGSGGMDAYLVRTDANGDLTWANPYGTSSQEAGFDVSLCSDGGYVVAGTSIC